MYATCMFCRQPLGTNEVIEAFPVGRRLAFDADRGRLWVVCRHCERWNLSPVEERWEAVEALERTFRDTRLRVSSENIGLARHAEGLELVRIGRPMRPEFAAWRYGDQFGRRRRRALVLGAGALAVAGGATVVGTAMLGGGAGGYVIWQLVDSIAASRTRAMLRTKDGRVLKLKRDDLPTARLQPSTDGPFRLSVLKGRKQTWFDGEEAERFAGLIIPQLNRMGGNPRAVQRAVRAIEDSGHPERFVEEIVRSDAFHRKGEPGFLQKMPVETRLALEMSLHEDSERRALEGELRLLERAWAEAEEIAGISDDLLIGARVRSFLDRHRPGGSD